MAEKIQSDNNTSWFLPLQARSQDLAQKKFCYNLILVGGVLLLSISCFISRNYQNYTDIWEL